MFKNILVLLIAVTAYSCSTRESIQPASLLDAMTEVEKIAGNQQYIHSPFVTPGDRAYLVGHQDGTFPPLGWHITGEMGGLWAHPVKLLDGFSAALHGTNEVLCLTEADSFVNYPFANKHIYASPFNTRITRFQYSPEGLPAIVVEYTFENLLHERQEYLFEFNITSDLRPTWLGERTGMNNHPDIINWNNDLNALVARDSLNPWHLVAGSPDKHLRYDLENDRCDMEVSDDNATGSLTWIVELPSNGKKTITIVLAGDARGFDEAASAFSTVLENRQELLENKKEKYAGIANSSNLILEDKKLEQTFRWIKYNTDWLIQDVPGVGRGLTAGIPDYPWWFGADSEYALQGAIMTGQTELVYETIDLIFRISQKTNGNGRVVHEVSSNGAVFNPGNINETPQFVSLIWRVFQWTGDQEFLKKYYPFLVDGMEWLLEETDKDANLLPDGFGMMEIHGLNSEMIDVAVYTQKAFADLAEMAGFLGNTEHEMEFREKADKLEDIIRNEYWVEDFESYADFIGTAEQAEHLVEDAIHRADSLGKPWAVEELENTRAQVKVLPRDAKQGFVLHHNWVVNTPMETGVADSTKALKALNTGSKYVNPFGVFVTGIDRDESAGDDAGSFQTNRKIFTYIGAVMTLPTGVQAVAENNYGRPDAALDYIQRMTRSFSYALPGSMYEVSPDFGMMTQAWNIYSYAVPIIHQFFGIKPDAQHQHITIAPQIPSSWNSGRLENVKIGDNTLQISFERKADRIEVKLEQEKPWDITVQYTNESLEMEKLRVKDTRFITFTIHE